MSTSPAVGSALEPEDPGILAANLSTGVRLFASAVVFVFVAFVFAFFYLKTVNSNGLWRPGRTHASQGFGVAILLCVLASAALSVAARHALVLARRRALLSALSIAVALGVSAFALQIIQYPSLNFTATRGGYASVFYGWTVLFLLFWLGAVYWLETLLATTLRCTPKDDRMSGEAIELVRPSAEACVIYLNVMAGIELVAYVLLYLVK